MVLKQEFLKKQCFRDFIDFGCETQSQPSDMVPECIGHMFFWQLSSLFDYWSTNTPSRGKKGSCYKTVCAKAVTEFNDTVSISSRYYLELQSSQTLWRKFLLYEQNIPIRITSSQLSILYQYTLHLISLLWWTCAISFIPNTQHLVF